MNLYRPVWQEPNIDRLFDRVCGDLIVAPAVDTGHWQAKKGVPQTQSRELLNVTFELPIAGSAGAWAAWMKPNLPWAEDHFLERVSGQPLNPPPSHVNWPFNQAGNKDHMDGQRFSHSYPERMWPRHAPMGAERDEGIGPTRSRLEPGTNFGVRYRYGDLDDLVALLIKEPFTRQAYVPMWFPEDLAAANEAQRVPCSLGWHFILRRRALHCYYPMRSLDMLRYFRDDAYMAGRLCQWVVEQCRIRKGRDDNNVWHDVNPGILTMQAVSCHIFENDVPLIQAMKKKVA